MASQNLRAAAAVAINNSHGRDEERVAPKGATLSSLVLVPFFLKNSYLLAYAYNMSLRIAVINLQSGIGVTRGYSQYLTRGWRYLLPHHGLPIEEAAVFLASEQVDIALLTEVEGGSRRSRYLSHLAILSERTGLLHTKFFSTRSHGEVINEGNAVLSRIPILSTTAHPLTKSTNPRVLGVSVVQLENSTLSVCVVHLALRARARLAQLQELVGLLAKLDGPIILAGDFNERDHAAFDVLKAIGLTPMSVPTFPSWKPRHALQVLFVSSHLRVISISAPTHSPFSDHLPLLIEVEYM